MQLRPLGNSGLQVAPLALGCNVFGWTADEAMSFKLLDAFVDAGFNLIDTADAYSRWVPGHNGGESETIIGKWLARSGKRDQVVIATKVFNPMGSDPNQRGLSRKHIHHAIDASLRRLRTDYVDLYQIHRFDPDTPVEETMEALHDVVKAGKARYLGASSMWAWQFATMQHVAQRNGWTAFVSMQDQYNLLMREEEREMFGLLAHQGVGSIPYSPLAKGRVCRPWGERTARMDHDPVGKRFDLDADAPIVDAVQRIAEQRGVPMAQVALAWVLKNPVVTAPIVGATKPRHLEDAVEALAVTLTEDEITALEEHYRPRLPSAF